MKQILLLFLLIQAMTVAGQVTPGVEVLRDGGFAQLKGKRVGLITNPTGVDRDLKSTIDILNEAEGVNLVALFSPEHGIRGDHSAGNAVADETDPVTGIRVYSLHGRNLTPTPAMLSGIDVLVYDIQDIGSRSYTYISTMGRSMGACAKAGVEFMVLDRPDPLGGNKVEGPVVKPGYESFVSQYPIPYIYGLTPGELAMLLVGEEMLGKGVKPRLTVIPMEGWERDMTYEYTGLPWVIPSPNIPSAETAFYYPATGIAGELGGVTNGVGYTLPFMLYATPTTDGLRLTEALNSLNLPGVMFRPIAFKPYFSKFAGKNLSGTQVYITDPEAAELTLIQFYIMQEAARLNPADKVFSTEKQSRLSMFDKVTGNPAVRKQFTQRYRVADIIGIWNADTEKFKTLKQKYHMY